MCVRVCASGSGSVLVCVRAGVKASTCWHVVCVLTFMLGKTFNNKAALRVAFVCARERETARERGGGVCVCVYAVVHWCA